MLSHLRCSIQRFGLVVPLVVRNVGGTWHEAVGGNQRLKVLQEKGLAVAPCVVVTADDAEARLLSQALNHIAGGDNLGLRAQVLREVLESTPKTKCWRCSPRRPRHSKL
jgi:ParB family chromosome partitioning protein